MKGVMSQMPQTPGWRCGHGSTADEACRAASERPLCRPRGSMYGSHASPLLSLSLVKKQSTRRNDDSARPDSDITNMHRGQVPGHRWRWALTYGATVGLGAYMGTGTDGRRG